jgi:hypothetical protein
MGWQIAATSFVILMLCFFISGNDKTSLIYRITATIGGAMFFAIPIGLIIQIWQ